MAYHFGSGTLSATPTVGSPATFGALQDVSIDFSFTNKQLNGSNQFPLVIARGTGKIGGKAKFANIQAGLFKDLFFQGTKAVTGSTTTITITNQALGTTPFFSVTLSQTFRGKTMTLTLNSCTSNKLTMATKLEDFNIPEFDFEAMSDASGVVGILVIQE